MFFFKKYQFCPDLAAELKSAEKAFIIEFIKWSVEQKEISQTGYEAFFHEGQYWARDTMDAWAKRIPWKSKRQIERYFKELQEIGLIIGVKHEKKKSIHTKYYRVDDNALESLMASCRRYHQDDKTSVSSSRQKGGISTNTQANTQTNTLSNETEREGEKDIFQGLDLDFQPKESYEEIMPEFIALMARCGVGIRKKEIPTIERECRSLFKSPKQALEDAKKLAGNPYLRKQTTSFRAIFNLPMMERKKRNVEQNIKDKCGQCEMTFQGILKLVEDFADISNPEEVDKWLQFAWEN